MGHQRGYTKFSCYNRDKQHYWSQKVCPVREELKVGTKNIINLSSVGRDSIMLPPFHIKFGIIKQFVKVLDKSGKCFNSLPHKDPELGIET